MIRGVPYDAEVEYLESPGIQGQQPCIDTGIYGSDLYLHGGLQTDFEILSVQGFTVSANISYDHNLNFGGSHQNPREFYCRFNDEFKSYGPPTFKVSDFLGQRILLKALDGQFSTIINGFTQTGIYKQLCSNNNHSLSIFYRGNSVWYGKFRIFGAKVWGNDMLLVRDFIPVRVGQVGYMYDRVTRKLFGNQGTGSFLLGPDVARPVMGLHLYPH